jgi:DNA phosphorothioation-dependent restriction protein DptG
VNNASELYKLNACPAHEGRCKYFKKHLTLRNNREDAIMQIFQKFINAYIFVSLVQFVIAYTEVES